MNDFGSNFTVRGEDESFLQLRGFQNVDRPKNWKVTGKNEEGKPVAMVVRRILTPVVVGSKIYIPWKHRQNSDEPKGTMLYLAKKADGSGFVVPEILQKAMSADLAVKASLDYDMAKTQSVFRPVDIYMFLCFCIGEKDIDENTIYVGEYSKSIAKGLYKLEHKEHPTKKIKYAGEEVPVLLNGNIMLYNALISKITDPNKPDRYGTSYEVEADIENPFAMQVPSNVFEKGFPKNFNWDAVFNEKQQKAIQQYLETNKAGSLYDALKSKAEGLISSPTDIETALFKIDPEASDTNGVPLFPDVRKFLIAFEKESGIKMLGGKTNALPVTVTADDEDFGDDEPEDEEDNEPEDESFVQPKSKKAVEVETGFGTSVKKAKPTNPFDE